MLPLIKRLAALFETTLHNDIFIGIGQRAIKHDSTTDYELVAVFIDTSLLYHGAKIELTEIDLHRCINLHGARKPEYTAAFTAMRDIKKKMHAKQLSIYDVPSAHDVFNKHTATPAPIKNAAPQ